jgi:hypothetical protein
LVGQTGYKAGGAKQYVEHLKEMIDAHKAQQPPKENDRAGEAARQGGADKSGAAKKPATGLRP